MRILACSALLLLFAPPARAANAEAEPADVLATYQRGKAAYDRGEYDDALRAFDQAAQADPGRARWQYNRGLALKKLGRDTEAVQALMRSRELDPGYKVSEIDKKLAELDAPGGTGDSGGDGEGAGVVALAIAFGVFGVFGLIVFLSVRQGLKQSAALRPEALQERLLALGTRLVQLEHRFAAGEDAEARQSLEWATAQEREARKLLPKAVLKVKRARSMASCLGTGEAAADACARRLDAVFGPAVAGSGARGERVGCWFCAKPLAHRDARAAQELRLGDQSAKAIVCPACAQLAQQGRPPRVTMIPGPSGLKHWSEARDFDPYEHRHHPHPRAQSVGLHKASAGLDLGTLGRAVAGGAIAVGAAAAVAQLLDLDALGEAAAAEAAAKASAEGGDRASSADHS